MGRPDPHPLALKLHLALNAAALLSAAVLMTLLARSGGLSSPRLILVVATAALALAVAGAAIHLHLQPAKERRLATAILEKKPRLGIALSAVFLGFWCLTWFPPQYTGDAYYYFIGLYPLILCGLLASGLALIFITAAADGFSRTYQKAYWREHRATLTAMLISLAAFLAITVLTRLWNVLQNNEPYWRGAGVPLLSVQVFIALMIGILALVLEVRLPRLPIRLDLALFLVIWAVAAVLWSSQPIGASYWVTGPRAPNHEYYPFSDLETFDLGSQFALIGQGIFNRQVWDRALYMSFLVFLHAAGGQDYQQLMSIQAALFAIFPALLYLMGRRLHSRNAGIILAALTVMRGLNSLTSAPLIHSSTFKHMLTDFPTAIGLAIFVLLLLKWLESPANRRGAGLWAAGVLGLTSLLRPHVLMLLAAVLLPGLLVGRSRRSPGLLMSGLALVAFLAGIAPWMFFGSGGGSLINFYGRRIQDVVQQRYPRLSATPPRSAPRTAEPLVPAPTESSGPAQEAPQDQETPAPVPTVLPPGARALPPPTTSGLPFPVLHYLHNLITSALVFPGSPEFLSVNDTLKGGENFWQLRWDGRMSSVAAGMLMVNLLIVAFGLGAAYQRLRWRGLLPLAVFLIYHGANALARTSGGRYLVPADWILVCYYGLGLAELLRLGYSLVRPESSAAREAAAALRASEGPVWSLRTLSILPGLFLIGCLVPLAGVLHPLRYPPQPASALIEESNPYMGSLGLNSEDVEAFLTQPGAVVLNGRALYPRFYRQGVGVLFSNQPFHALNYPRTIFVLIGPHGMVYVILPGRAPETLPNASDAIVLGCRGGDQYYNLVSALAVVLPRQAVATARSPAAPLTCPLPEPVCDNNGNCY
ncbi:MAG: hypothetical protein V1755_11360 [Chloroflexota bacterium]